MPSSNPEPSGQDPLGHAWCAPAAVFGEADERPKTLSVAPDRYAAVVSSGLLRFDGVVDIRDLHRRKLLAAGGEAVEELLDAAKLLADGSFGITALSAHPSLIGDDLGTTEFARLIGFIEPAQKPQSPDDAAQHTLRLFLRGQSPVADFVMPRAIPFRGCGLDLGNGDLVG